MCALSPTTWWSAWAGSADAAGAGAGTIAEAVAAVAETPPRLPKAERRFGWALRAGRSRRAAFRPCPVLVLAWIGLAAGCASGDGGSAGGVGGSARSDAGSGANAPGMFGSFPAALGARWAPPPFATRSVDGERAAVVDACVAVANSLGYGVGRVDVATGKVAAARRQTTGFDGARQDTLEITVSTLAPGISRVATVLRETVESGGDGGHAGAGVTTGLVRDRAAYDVFFARLGAALGSAEVTTPAAAP